MSPSVSNQPFAADSALLAQISYEPVPDWVQPVDFDPKYPRKDSLPLTYLLLEHQDHAELRSYHARQVVRLETMQAVQQMSQWRTSFDPLTQALTLHHLRIHRNSEVFDYAKPENVRILQREEGLEAFILHGRVTVLVVFDDVRPGDIIETCYSTSHTPHLLPHRHSAFFTLPEAFTVAKHHHSLVFEPSRGMKWNSSTPDRLPAADLVDSFTRWTWAGADHLAVEPEPNVPGTELPPHWLQFSDVADWAEVSQAAALAWNEDDNDELLESCIAGIREATADPLERIERVLRFAQDEFRYLSVNLELGGHIPTPPATVLRRRYGDCKDLSFLLSCLLRKLGVAARPVLVNTHLGPTVATLLPGAHHFNHAIIELTVDGETRWVDATIPRQGGGPLGRSVPPFGFGLPVANPGAPLTSQPAPLREPDRYEIHETLLLDTSGNPSLLKFSIRATGRHADNLRAQIESEGIDSYAVTRTKWHAQRYGSASLVETPVFADNRDLNEWRLNELFLVDGFLVQNPASRLAVFNFPQNLAAASLPLPSKDKRRQSFALPDDLHIDHTVEVRANAFHQQPASVKILKHPGVIVKIDDKYQAGRWSRRTSLATSAAAIPAAEIEPFRKLVESVWSTHWTLSATAGIPRRPRPPDFNLLPESTAKRPAPPADASVSATPFPGSSEAQAAPAVHTPPALPLTPTPIADNTVAEAITPAAPVAAPRPRSGRSRATRRRRRTHKHNLSIIVGIIVLVLSIAAIVIGIYFYA